MTHLGDDRFSASPGIIVGIEDSEDREGSREFTVPCIAVRLHGSRVLHLTWSEVDDLVIALMECKTLSIRG